MLDFEQHYNPETEREIYEKWLQKCKEDADYSRQKTEQNNLDRIRYERNILNSLETIPTPEDSNKLYTPYMRHHHSDLSKSTPDIHGTLNKTANDDYELYTLDGYPRRNYAKLYENHYKILEKGSLPNGYGNSKNNTDITNPAKYERIRNGTYDAYRAKNQEYLNYNVHVAKDNIRYKDFLLGEKKKMNEERVKETERLKILDYESKIYETEKKKAYKNLLDNQLKVKIPSKIGSVYYNNINFEDKIDKLQNPQLYLNTPKLNFINRNKVVEINPYSMKKTELGYSDLEHNTILNPVFDYRYNRYLFPRQDYYHQYYTFQDLGRDLVNKKN